MKELLDAAALPLHALRGLPPWSPGYYTRKKSHIQRAIDSGAVAIDRPLPERFGVAIDERAVEYPWLFDRLRHVNSLGRVLDAGSTLNYDYILDQAPLRKANMTIMTLAPEKRCYWHEGYSYVFGDFRDTAFKDEAFDTIICISTLEHVGLDNTLLYTDDPKKAEMDKYGFVTAICEFDRILAPGGHCFITVPYGRYENFNWFHLFDREMINILVETFSPSAVDMEFFRYTRSGWQRASEAEVFDATAFDPHSGRGRLDDGAACARAIACIQMRK